MKRPSNGLLFWGTVAGAAIVVAAAGLVMLLHPKSNQATTYLNLTNASLFSDQLGQSGISSTQQGVAEMLTYNGATGSLSGAIRQGSLSQTFDQIDQQMVPYTSFLVDIPAAKQSYVVSIQGGTGYEMDILHVTCPTTDQLKYGPFDCHEQEQ